MEILNDADEPPGRLLPVAARDVKRQTASESPHAVVPVERDVRPLGREASDVDRHIVRSEAVRHRRRTADARQRAGANGPQRMTRMIGVAARADASDAVIVPPGSCPDSGVTTRRPRRDDRRKCPRASRARCGPVAAPANLNPGSCWKSLNCWRSTLAASCEMMRRPHGLPAERLDAVRELRVAPRISSPRSRRQTPRVSSAAIRRASGTGRVFTPARSLVNGRRDRAPVLRHRKTPVSRRRPQIPRLVLEEELAQCRGKFTRDCTL